MNTVVWKNETGQAAALLRDGGLVAVPTETVYGLACNGLDAEAVERLYEVKGRPSVKPLSLMVPGPDSIDDCCRDVPAAARVLAGRFWPGPLTLVLPAKEHVPAIVRAGGDTIGLRCPDHPLTLALLREAGVPFAAPSANPSGEASPKDAGAVLRYFDGKIEAVIDGGPCGLGTESTIVSLAEKPYRVLRQGALPEQEIADALVDAMTVIGITGGSGGGKTTALRVLESLGALVLDADQVYRELLTSDPELLDDIEARFPGTVTSGVLNRRALAAAVFSDAGALDDLNRIAHPRVIAETKRRLRAYAMQGGTLAALDAIALLESGLDALCDRCFAVTAPREARIARIMARDALSREEAERRIDAQRPDTYYTVRCGSVLYNDADEASFTARCRQKFMEVISHG